MTKARTGSVSNFGVRLGGLSYTVDVAPDRSRGGYSARLISTGVGTIMEPNGSSPSDALTRLVTELSGGDATDRKLAKEIARHAWFPLTTGAPRSHATKRVSEEGPVTASIRLSGAPAPMQTREFKRRSEAEAWLDQQRAIAERRGWGSYNFEIVPSKGGRSHAAKKIAKLPGLAKWNMFAGGTAAAEGKHGYDLHVPEGQYTIWPISSRHGRHIGYSLKFAATGGQPRGGHSGLWHDLGTFNSPQKAVSAANKHYAGSF